MITNLAFLITKSKKEDFEKEVEQLDKKFTGKINFRLVGPLPPYSFATFEIKKITPEEIFYAKAVLGIIEDPRPEEVKQAYYAMAQKLHPDKNPDNPEAARQFEELKMAFDLLYEYSSNGRDLFLIKKLTLST
jgi:DnaJ-class molecular chaperone